MRTLKGSLVEVGTPSGALILQFKEKTILV